MNRNGLESALFSPAYSFGGVYKYKTVLDRAAALLDGLCQNHPFEQGNKRTAWLTTITYLSVHGMVLCRVPDEQAAQFVLDVVNHQHEHSARVIWLANRLA